MERIETVVEGHVEWRDWNKWEGDGPTDPKVCFMNVFYRVCKQDARFLHR